MTEKLKLKFCSTILWNMKFLLDSTLKWIIDFAKW